MPIPGLAKAAEAWSLALHARGPAKIQPPEVLAPINEKSVWRPKFDLHAGRDKIGNHFRVASGAQPAITLALAGTVFKYSTDSTREPPKICSFAALAASSG
jgi:hypothetical protein